MASSALGSSFLGSSLASSALGSSFLGSSLNFLSFRLFFLYGFFLASSALGSPFPSTTSAPEDSYTFFSYFSFRLLLSLKGSLLWNFPQALKASYL